MNAVMLVGAFIYLLFCGGVFLIFLAGIAMGFCMLAKGVLNIVYGKPFDEGRWV